MTTNDDKPEVAAAQTHDSEPARVDVGDDVDSMPLQQIVGLLVGPERIAPAATMAHGDLMLQQRAKTAETAYAVECAAKAIVIAERDEWKERAETAERELKEWLDARCLDAGEDSDDWLEAQEAMIGDQGLLHRNHAWTVRHRLKALADHVETADRECDELRAKLQDAEEELATLRERLDAGCDR